ncbi:MAG: cobalamin biosynthesis protein CobD [Archaeoglobus sp.]|nr:cobalamin biosynthesis protein CobD [Archaeoglobus sp.]
MFESCVLPSPPLIALTLALIFDLIFGEPRRFHPTVWFGRLISFFDRKYGRSCGDHENKKRIIDLLAGTLFSLVVILLAVLLSFLPSFFPHPLSLLFTAYLLKTTFSIRSLEEHVRNAAVFDVEEKRKRVSMIVSRDSSKLSEEELNSAAIESLAENLVDSIISPIFYFMIFGLLGAMVYRAVNTLDAMIGYKDERYENFGKFAAKLDDLLNFIPARISVLLFLPLSRRVWKYYRMARFKLNGDKPIAAMSAVLGVKLEKRGSYSFPGKIPSNTDILRSLRISRVICIEWIAIAFAFLALKGGTIL